MQQNFNIRKEDMPSEMHALLASYPRDSWDTHPGFADKTRQWLGAHQMFRRLAEIVRLDSEAVIDREMDIEGYAGRLSVFGNRLIGNLHAHHGWEDREYFPELRAADQRFDVGLEILEKDHEALDTVLESFAGTGNRAIKLFQLDEVQAREEVGALQGISETIEAFLNRHLSDEEELAVPIILHHRLRG